MIVKITEDPLDSLQIKLPKFICDKINKSIEDEVNKASDVYDPFGLCNLNRTYRSNLNSFRDRVFYIVYLIYKKLSMKSRLKMTVLCTDYSEKQLSNLLGDCSRNRTKIGWQSIKKFLIENKIIIIADSLFIHDSYLNKSQSLAYSIYEFKGLKSKPTIRVSKKGFRYSSNKLFSVEELEYEEYLITNKSLLKSIAIDSSYEIDTDTVVGHQWELLNKYKADKLDYDFVTNCISGQNGVRYPFHEDKNKDGKTGECSLIKSLTLPDHSFKDFRVKQSPYSSRIFSPLTSCRKYARSFINFNDKDNIFAEFDMKSSQLSLAALLYHKQVHNFDSIYVLNTIVRNDIYQMISKICPKDDGSYYKRDEIKELAFKSIFSKVDYSDNVFTTGLKKLFPDFYKFLNSHKTKSKHSKLAIKLQRLESSIFVGDYKYNYKTGISEVKYPTPFTDGNICILGELYKLGIDAFSIHDSILVNVSQAAKFTSTGSTEDVWDELLAKIVWKVFNQKFGNLCFGADKASWVFGLKDQTDIYYNDFLKFTGEMKLFTRHDNFNQFSPELFIDIDQRYGTGLFFSTYEEYRKFTEVGDFRKVVYDNPDDDFWETHDKNDYKEYFEMIEDCPF